MTWFDLVLYAIGFMFAGGFIGFALGSLWMALRFVGSFDERRMANEEASWD